MVRVIAWLSILGVGLSSMALVVVLSVMNGFGDSIRNRLLRLEPHLHVRDADFNRAVEILDLKSDPRIDAVERATYQDSVVKSIDGLFGGAVIVALTQDGLKRVVDADRKVEFEEQISGGLSSGKAKDWGSGSGLSLEEESSELIGDSISGGLSPSESRFYKDAAKSSEIRGALVGFELARSLGIFEQDTLTLVPPEQLLLPPGESLPLEQVDVSKVLQTNVAEIDSNYMFVPIDTVNLYPSSSKWIGWQVRLKNLDDTQSIARLLKDKGFDVETWQERNSALFYSLKMEKFLIGLFLSIAFVIASLAMVMVMNLLVAQKRHEIAALRTLGFTERSVRNVFVKMGCALSGLGIGIGVILGLLICYILDKYPIIRLPDFYYDTRIPIHVEWIHVAIVVLLGVTVAYLGSLVPSLAASRVHPALALRK